MRGSGTIYRPQIIYHFQTFDQFVLACQSTKNWAVSCIKIAVAWLTINYFKCLFVTLLRLIVIFMFAFCNSSLPDYFFASFCL